MRGPEALELVDQLQAERDNFRAALAWGLAASPELALRLAGALGWFWWTGSYQRRAGAGSNEHFSPILNRPEHRRRRCTRRDGSRIISAISMKHASSLCSPSRWLRCRCGYLALRVAARRAPLWLAM
jgi:hypothetical protein